METRKNCYGSNRTLHLILTVNPSILTLFHSKVRMLGLFLLFFFLIRQVVYNSGSALPFGYPSKIPHCPKDSLRDAYVNQLTGLAE